MVADPQRGGHQNVTGRRANGDNEISSANKLARIAWSVLAHGRAFEVRKMDEAAARSA